MALQYWKNKKCPDCEKLICNTSTKCASCVRKGMKFSDEHRKNISKYVKANPVKYWNGKKRGYMPWLHTEEVEMAKSNVMTGKKLPKRQGEAQWNYKGEQVSYRNLHRWVERQIGKPCQCSQCGKIGYGRKMHWANKSGEYRRLLSDWLRLCSSCHAVYDKQLGLRKHNITI